MKSKVKIDRVLLVILLEFIIIFFAFYNNLCVKTYASNTVSEIVMDAKTNRILFENNAYERKFMASTTKILTALVIIENCNLDDVVTISKDTVGVEGSSIYLEVGEKLSVKDLLYGLMLRSGNDCAETLAVYCSGSVHDFAKLMNETAKKLCVKDSNFVNPHGLHDDEHYTTAYDLAIISSYAIKNPIFKEIVSTKSVKIPFSTRNQSRYLVNKNKLLNQLEGATGIKTGYTKKAGRCLVSSVNRNGQELVCVVLNCPPMFERSKNLLNDACDKYKPYKIIESDYVLDFIDVEGCDEKCGICVKNDVILPLTAEEKQNLVVKYIYPKIIKTSTPKDQEIGRIEFYYKNNLIFSEKIYTI